MPGKADFFILDRKLLFQVQVAVRARVSLAQGVSCWTLEKTPGCLILIVLRKIRIYT
jgi:hypothetical protein